jgi:hypothetical protein
MLLVHRTLDLAFRDGSEFVLLLEDDLIFNKHLRHNLVNWQPLRTACGSDHFFATLFNPAATVARGDCRLRHAEVQPASARGAQALVLSHRTLGYLVTCWGMLPAMHADVKMAKLAGRVCRIFRHVPSLVQHVGLESVWGGPFIAAADFNKHWKARIRSDLREV